MKAMDWWNIHLLSSEDGKRRLDRYTMMEKTFAGSFKDPPRKMFELLKESFDDNFLKKLGINFDDLGVLGVRNDEFSRLLGLGRKEIGSDAAFATPSAASSFAAPPKARTPAEKRGSTTPAAGARKSSRKQNDRPWRRSSGPPATRMCPP